MYVQSDTLSLARIFEIFRHMCLWNAWLRSGSFLTGSRLVWQEALGNTRVSLDILIDINMLLVVEKDIRWEICHAIHQHSNANDKYIKDHNKNEEL